MVVFPFDLQNFYSLATSQGYMHWLNLGITLILSTLIGGILLIVLAKLLGKWVGNISHYSHAFMVVLVINMINFFGILGLLLGFLIVVPWLGLLLPVLVWIALLKLFFGELNFKGAVILGIISYLVSMLLLGTLVSLAGSFIMF